MDRQRDPRRGETPRRPEHRTRWTTWTRRPSVDGDRFTHNPEVAASNPAPATNFRRSRPFSYQGEGLLRAGHCSKTCSRSSAPRGLAARRGRRVTRDETTWTRWTLPPVTSGRLAQRWVRCPCRLHHDHYLRVYPRFLSWRAGSVAGGVPDGVLLLEGRISSSVRCTSRAAAASARWCGLAEIPSPGASGVVGAGCRVARR